MAQSRSFVALIIEYFMKSYVHKISKMLKKIIAMYLYNGEFYYISNEYVKHMKA